MPQYIKNEDGTLTIKTERVEIVDLKELERQLEQQKQWNKDIERLIIWRDSLKEQWQKDAVLITPFFDTTQLEEKINFLKSQNG